MRIPAYLRLSRHGIYFFRICIPVPLQDRRREKVGAKRCIGEVRAGRLGHAARVHGGRHERQLDGATQRLLVMADHADDLAAFGLDCGEASGGLQRVVQRLRSACVAVEDAPASLLQARRVEHLMRARDPAGNWVELFTGLEVAAEPFSSQAFPRGFVTGSLGMGHLVLVHEDLQAMESFYTTVGFDVTERLHAKVGPISIDGTFMHCNRRHHSLALFHLPSGKRLHHFMLQARDHIDVGRAYERTKQCKVPLALTIGQHPDPDGTFSFYGVTLSGFDFEIGAGSQEVEPAGRPADHTNVTSSWGHQPQLRLKLRLVGPCCASRAGVRRSAGSANPRGAWCGTP